MTNALLFERITAMHQADRTLLVGLDGLGGAGKSTLAAALCCELADAGLHPVLLHLDDFIHPRAVRYQDAYPEWECYYRLQWRYDYLRNQLLLPAQNGTAVDALTEFYQLSDDSYRLQTVQIPVGSIVIVEGIFLHRPELAGLFDLTVYVDVPEDVRLSRVLERDGYIGDQSEIMAKYERRYFPAERFYVQKCKPAEAADLLIQTEKPAD